MYQGFNETEDVREVALLMRSPVQINRSIFMLFINFFQLECREYGLVRFECRVDDVTLQISTFVCCASKHSRL